MTATFSDHLRNLSRSIPPELIAESELEEIMKLSSLFPFDVSADLGFECRLGDERARCDFFMLIQQGTEGADALSGKSRISSLSNALMDIPFWKKLQRLFQIWNDPSRSLISEVEMFWLEFDREEMGFNPVPNLFFRLREKDCLKNPHRWEAMKDILNEIYHILFDIPFPPHLAVTLQRCMKLLPPDSAIYQVGFMIPRKTEAIRLILTSMHPDKLTGYLKRIEWSGDYAAVERMFSRYAAGFDYTVCNLHIGEKVLPYLGLELYFRNLAQPKWELRWKENLDLFISDNLVLPAKSLALQSFPGITNSEVLFPVRYIHGINHLKVVYKAGHPLECKAYFGAKIRNRQLENHHNP